MSHNIKYGASTAVFKQDEVLLVLRGGGGALQDLWSLPGGHLFEGETANEAALRELKEETGIQPSQLSFVDEINVQTDKSLYRISVYYGIWLCGNVHAGDDAKDARWVALESIPELRTTDGLLEIVTKAYKLLRSQTIQDK